MREHPGRDRKGISDMDHDSKTPRQQMKAIIDGMCAGNASMATDAILAEFVVIPRSELPEVEDRGGLRLLVAEHTYPAAASPKDLREEALRRIAVADYLATRESEQAASEAKRNARRDELAQEITQDDSWPYAQLGAYTQRAIDLMIDLEEAAA
jgi:hypothetical protein